MLLYCTSTRAQKEYLPNRIVFVILVKPFPSDTFSLSPHTPSVPCTPLKPLTSLDDLAADGEDKPVCGAGATLRALYKVDVNEAGPLILPIPVTRISYNRRGGWGGQAGWAKFPTFTEN